MRQRKINEIASKAGKALDIDIRDIYTLVTNYSIKWIEILKNRIGLKK